MKKLTDAQKVNVRERMIWEVMSENGIDPNDRIGGRVSMRQYARDLALRPVGEYALMITGQQMSAKLAELGDEEAVWRFFLAKHCPDQEPQGEEESRVSVANAADAQAAIQNAALFRANLEGKKDA